MLGNKSKEAIQPKEGEIYTIDDKDFEKRYAGKLTKSGDGSVNIATMN